MALKSRLRRALTGGSSPISGPSSSSSSSSDLSTTPTVNSATLPQLSTAQTAPLTRSPTSPTAPLTKTPSRLRTLLSRSKTPKDKKASSATALHPEWHDYTGPRSRFRKTVDPAHRARLEAWGFEDGWGRKASVASSYYRGGVSPCQSRAASLDLRPGEDDE